MSKWLLLKGTAWTLATFCASLILRLGSSVVMTRLLTPQVFGVMQIVYSLQTGVELLTDVGIGQSVIYNKDSRSPDFYNTAWTLQLIRGAFLAIAWCLLSWPAAHFYGVPILINVMSVGAIGIVIFGFVSPSKFLLQKNMQYSKIAGLDIATYLTMVLVQVGYAYVSPTIWSLVFGSLAGYIVYTLGSFCLLPEMKHRVQISATYKRQILSFGKWIFLSSVIYFFSTNIDRLYLGKLIPLELLGVYGIARGFAGLSTTAVMQLGSNVIFPFVVSHSQLQRKELRAQVHRTRFNFLLVAAVGFALFASLADLLIRLLYDQRYSAAAWMLPILLFGAWFSLLCTVNESTLLGIGRPQYSAFANFIKVVFILGGLSLGATRYGAFGAVIAVGFSDLCRYFPLFIGQLHERFSYGKQDLLLTFVVVILIVLVQLLRWYLGLGTSFDSLPVDFKFFVW